MRKDGSYSKREAMVINLLESSYRRLTYKQINDKCGTTEARKIISDLISAGVPIHKNWIYVHCKDGSVSHVMEIWMS